MGIHCRKGIPGNESYNDSVLNGQKCLVGLYLDTHCGHCCMQRLHPKAHMLESNELAAVWLDRRVAQTQGAGKQNDSWRCMSLSRPIAEGVGQKQLGKNAQNV